MPKLISRANFDQIVELLQDDLHSCKAIGEMVGVHGTVVTTIARGKHFYQADEAEQERRKAKRYVPPGGHYLPTPEEIAEACERIQAERRRVAVEDEPVLPERLLTAV